MFVGLNESQVIEIYNQRDDKTLEDLAKMYNVTKGTIRDIHNKKVWKHVFKSLEETA